MWHMAQNTQLELTTLWQSKNEGRRQPASRCSTWTHLSFDVGISWPLLPSAEWEGTPADGVPPRLRRETFVIVPTCRVILTGIMPGQKHPYYNPVSRRHETDPEGHVHRKGGTTNVTPMHKQDSSFISVINNIGKNNVD